MPAPADKIYLWFVEQSDGKHKLLLDQNAAVMGSFWPDTARGLEGRVKRLSGDRPYRLVCYSSIEILAESTLPLDDAEIRANLLT